MKSVLISIRPKWVKKIALGEKTIEVRRNRPKIETPFKCYIYCTKERLTKRTINMQSYLHVNEERVQKDYGKITTWGKMGDVLVNEWLDNYKYISYGMHGKVIGEFTCDKINITAAEWVTQEELQNSCLTREQIKEYGNGKALYGWHISDLIIYDKPRDLSDFVYICPYDKEREYYHDELYPSCGNEGCKYNFRNLDTGFWECRRIITRAPQSWCFCEKIK